MTNRTASHRKLPPKYAAIILPLILSVMMTFIISGVATWRSIGLTADFVWTWMSAWGLSWVVAFPTLLLVLPLVRRLVGLIVEAPGTKG